MYEEKENMTTEFEAIITEINQHYGTQLELKDSNLNQYEVMKLIINNKYKYISPIVKLVVRAIVQLECEITKGMLATSRITEIVNVGLEEKYQVAVSAVGKAATSLKLTTKRMPDGQRRGIVIQKQDIKGLKILLGIPSDN